MDRVRRRIQVIKLGQRVDNILKLSLISCSKPERMIKNDLAAKIRSLDIFCAYRWGPNMEREEPWNLVIRRGLIT